jgi:hypothetical protein
MARTFPRNVEEVIRVLTGLCKDEKQPPAMRARCGELVLSAYGLVALSPEQKPRHQNLKQIQSALELSGTDRKIAGKVRAERREQITKLKQELKTL